MRPPTASSGQSLLPLTRHSHAPWILRPLGRGASIPTPRGGRSVSTETYMQRCARYEPRGGNLHQPRFCGGEPSCYHSPLNGLRILVVEDEPVIALHITLVEAGAEVIGPAPTTARAFRLMGCSQVDAAVIDYRLEAGTASLLAHRLAAMRVPFLFHTSSGSHPGLIHPGVPIVNKPSRPEQLVAAVCDLTRRIERSG